MRGKAVPIKISFLCVSVFTKHFVASPRETMILNLEGTWMSSDIAIKVENLSKCYQIYDTPRDRLKQFVYPKAKGLIAPVGRLLGSRSPLAARLAPHNYYKEFWALKNVSFEVKKGETVGIIGRNGSGKSTLLQMICGTLTPTSGSVRTNGRIAALLELGSGFNPEFSGRENVYMNASILGLSQDEIDARFDDIAGFADIGVFIDQPVKCYSSGMMVRLAFAVQAQVNPDILIVDEALAVGDVKFQARCFDRLRQLKEEGTSILLVTHSSEQIVTHCSAALLLDSGKTIEAGEPRHVVNCYLDLLFGKKRKMLTESEQAQTDPTKTALEVIAECSMLSSDEDLFSTRPGYNPHEYRWGDGSAVILDYYLASDEEIFPSALTTGQRFALGVNIKFIGDLVRPIFGITFKTKEGVTIYGVNSETLDVDEFITFGKAGTIVHAKAFFSCHLAPGDYFVSFGVATQKGEEVIPHDRRYDAIHLQVRPTSKFFGLVDLSCDISTKLVTL